MLEENNAWSLYWQQDTLQSCISSQNPADKAFIDSFWSGFAAELGDEAEIIDLASGNGAVPAAMLRHNKQFRITAVDYAEISPLKYLSNPGNLNVVKFIPATNIESLPLADRSFDAVTSQFGIEYANLNKVSTQIARVLRPGGRCQFLMHHRNSEIIKPNARLLPELARCLADKGIVHALFQYLQGDMQLLDLEAIGKQHLEANFTKSRQISGQIFEHIGTITQLANSDPIEAMQLARQMTKRIEAEQLRLQQMLDASLDEDELEAFLSLLEAKGLHQLSCAPLQLQEDSRNILVGWQVTANNP